MSVIPQRPVLLTLPAAAGATDPAPRPAEDDTGVHLARLVVAAAPPDEVLSAVAELARTVVPAADCAVTATLGRTSGPGPWVVGDHAAAVLVRNAAEHGDGPTAAGSPAGPWRVADVRHDERWPRWNRRAAGMGLRSALATRVEEVDVGLGVLWVAAEPDQFDTTDVAAAHRFTVVAAAALWTAVTSAELRRQRADLERALVSRATIDQAIGVLVARGGGTPDDAWRRLRAMSQREGQKVAEVARRTVEEATRRHGGTR